MYRGRTTALRALAILAILGATAGGAVAQAPHLQPKVASGALSGTVTDLGGSPLAGIRVDVYQQIGGLGGVFAGFASTDASGNYRVSGLGDGQYQLVFSDPSGTYATVYYDAQASSKAANEVYVTGGGETGGIDEVMFARSAIAGTVADAAGAPLAKVQVKVYTFDPPVALAGSATTDASGAYRVDDLLFGDYRVAFLTTCGTCNSGYVSEYYDDQPDSAHADRVALTAGTTTTLDASLAGAGSIFGTVTDDATGQPIVETNAIAYRFDPASGTWVWARGAITAPGGVYTIDRLAPGDYKVFFNDTRTFPAKAKYSSEYFHDEPDVDSADVVAVVAGADTPGIDGTLTYLATGSISGTVTDASGTPLAGIDVQLYGHQTGDWYAFGDPVQTDAAGQYLLTGLLADDDYKVRFSGGVYAPEHYDDAPTLAAATLVAVATDADTPGIDASLAAGGSIAGTVTDELGAPIQGIEVAAYSDVGGGQFWWQESATTRSSSWAPPPTTCPSSTTTGRTSPPRTR